MKKLLSLALLCCVILAMQAQSWSRVFNPSVTGDDEFFGVAPAPNGYIMAGTMRNAANTDTDGWITRVDNTGATVWSRQLQINNTNEVLYDVIQLSNGNYITVGYTEGTTRNALVVCFNANGVVQWNRTMNFGMNTETFSTAIQITGGNIMLAGGGGGGEGYVLACVTPTGNVIWRQSDKSAGTTDWIQHLLQTSDGSVAFCGFTLSGNAGGHSLWIGKIDPATGNFHWSRTYSSGSPSANQGSTGLIELAGQDLLCVGSSDAGNANNSNTAGRDITFTRIKAVTGTTTQGDVVFSRRFDNNNMSDNAYAFARTANNQIVIGGTTNVNGGIGVVAADMFIATFDTAANFISGGRYGLGFDDQGQRLCISGNNVLINGFSRSFLNSGAASATSSDRKGYAIQVPLNQLTSVCTANTLTFTQNTFAQTEDVLTYTAVQLDAIDSVNMH